MSPVGSGAALTARGITVINPDGGRSTVLNAFTIKPAPTVTSLSPSSRGQGATTENIVITGSNFGSAGWSNSSVAFSGGGVTVNSVTRNRLEPPHRQYLDRCGCRDRCPRRHRPQHGRRTDHRAGRIHREHRSRARVREPTITWSGRREPGDRRHGLELRGGGVADVGRRLLGERDHRQLGFPDRRRSPQREHLGRHGCRRWDPEPHGPQPVGWREGPAAAFPVPPPPPIGSRSPPRGAPLAPPGSPAPPAPQSEVGATPASGASGAPRGPSPPPGIATSPSTSTPPPPPRGAPGAAPNPTRPGEGSRATPPAPLPFPAERGVQARAPPGPRGRSPLQRPRGASARRTPAGPASWPADPPGWR